MGVYDEIAVMFDHQGQNAYHGECVSQAEHGIDGRHEYAGADHLCRWDGAANVSGLAVPGLDPYRARIESSATPSASLEGDPG